MGFRMGGDRWHLFVVRGAESAAGDFEKVVMVRVRDYSGIADYVGFG